jgi:hypothetical protein
VALFASADSVTAAKVVSCSSMALPLDSNVRDPNLVYLIVEYDRISRAIEVDRVVSFVQTGRGNRGWLAQLWASSMFQLDS